MIRVLCVVIVSLASVLAKSDRQFPEDFAFGVTTAATSIEGAWNIDDNGVIVATMPSSRDDCGGYSPYGLPQMALRDLLTVCDFIVPDKIRKYLANVAFIGKGESIWDYVSHLYPSKTNGSNADNSCESYFLFERDIQTIKELGLSHYRFSIAWSRILPEGTADKVNQKGIDYYNRLIDALICNGIEPWVTMNHWDIPQALQEKGGWVSENMAGWFGDYARILYNNFGDRVKIWITIDQPFYFCLRGYESADYAPLISDPGRGIYECGRNVILANARAYHIYDKEFRAEQEGRVGIDLVIRYAAAASDSADDIAAARDYMTFHFDQYMYPIYGETGQYPQKMIDRIAEASAEEGLSESRLRPFTEEEAAHIKGTSDFLALSHFTSLIAYRNASVAGLNAVPSFINDVNVGTYTDPSWPTYGIIKSYAKGFYYVLKYVSENYNNALTYVTGNGASSYDSGLEDDFRVDYLREHLNYLLDARDEGVNVQGYFVWSLMDKFEWASGYSTKYGLYQTDFSSEEKTRTARKSAYVYKEIVRSRVVDSDYVPDCSVAISEA